MARVSMMTCTVLHTIDSHLSWSRVLHLRQPARCTHPRSSPGIAWEVDRNRINMKYVVYGLFSILTSSAAATAVLQYTAALSQSALTDVVTMPAVDLTGARTEVDLVLGPGIPVLAEEAADDVLEPTDQDFLDDIAARTHAARAGFRHHA